MTNTIKTVPDGPLLRQGKVLASDHVKATGSDYSLICCAYKNQHKCVFWGGSAA
jgi:hypothetical protein